jgi:hypothetical protein
LGIVSSDVGNNHGFDVALQSGELQVLQDGTPG